MLIHGNKFEVLLDASHEVRSQNRLAASELVEKLTATSHGEASFAGDLGVASGVLWRISSPSSVLILEIPFSGSRPGRPCRRSPPTSVKRKARNHGTLCLSTARRRQPISLRESRSPVACETHCAATAEPLRSAIVALPPRQISRVH